MRNKIFLLLSLLIMASMILSACQQQPATQVAPPAAGETAAPAAAPAEAATAAPAAPAAAAPASNFKNPDTITYITGAGEPENT